MEKVKNQHYVPRCYLKRFTTIEDKDRIYIFDKVKMEPRKQLIENVASQRYFYDIPFEKFINEVGEEKIKEALNVDNLDFIHNQEIEKHFADNVEGSYDQKLNNIVSLYNLIQESSYDKCIAINENLKFHLSILITHQILRTKEFREFVIQMHEIGFKTIIDKLMKFEFSEYDPSSMRLELKKEAIPLRHAEILTDNETIMQFAEILFKHIWMIGVNKTGIPFYTSDNPVVKRGHIKDKFFSYNGLASKGIEIALPINPNLILLMYERSHFESIKFKENKFILMDDPQNIIHYNSLQVFQSNRQVYSSIDNFDLATDICNQHPEVRDQNRKRISSG